MLHIFACELVFLGSWALAGSILMFFFFCSALALYSLLFTPVSSALRIHHIINHANYLCNCYDTEGMHCPGAPCTVPLVTGQYHYLSL